MKFFISSRKSKSLSADETALTDRVSGMFELGFKAERNNEKDYVLLAFDFMSFYEFCLH